MTELSRDKQMEQGAMRWGSLFQNAKVWYTTKEAAAIIGTSIQFVRDAFDNQELMGQEIASRRHPQVRRMKLIHRDCLMVFLLETANYTPVDFLERLKRLLLNCSREEQKNVLAWLELKLRVPMMAGAGRRQV